MDTLSVPFQFKSIDDAGVIEGIAAGIGNVDFGGDRIMPGAFSKTLAVRGGEPLPMLLHHDLKRPIGAWTDVKEVGDALHAKGRITLASRDGAEAYALARDGGLRGLSIGYTVARANHTRAAIKDLHEIKLHEVSLVSVGMNERARVRTVKSLTNPADLEDLFRDYGMSGRKAKIAASAAWKSINETEDEADELSAIFAASAKRLGFFQRS